MGPVFPPNPLDGERDVTETPESRDAQGVLIRPARGRRDPEAAPDLILAMTETLLDRLVGLLAARTVSMPRGGLFRAYEAKEEAPRRRLTLAGPFLGAPQAVLGLEKMIALGARRVWVVGWCGSLQPDLRIGDLVAPLDALSEEGTSKHYPLEGAAPRTDEGLQRLLVSELKEGGRNARKGRVWTTDAPYRETRQKVRAYRDQGILGVDMELSALLAVSAFRGVRPAALFVVSDELFDGTWRPGFSDPRLRAAEEAAARALDAALARAGGEAQEAPAAAGERE